jgi:hypothetical protein
MEEDEGRLLPTHSTEFNAILRFVEHFSLLRLGISVFET